MKKGRYFLMAIKSLKIARRAEKDRIGRGLFNGRNIFIFEGLVNSHLKSFVKKKRAINGVYDDPKL